MKLRLRQLTETVLGIIVIALAIYGGIYAYFQLKTLENVSNTDIFEAIPGQPQTMLVVHNPKQLFEVWNTCNDYINLLPEEKSLTVVDIIGKVQMCSERCIDKEPLVISYYPEGTLLFMRMKQKDFKYMEKRFFTDHLSGFAAKKEIYKNAEISIKATNNEDFFCYTLYNNIFIGSHERKLIYKAIDSYDNKTGLHISQFDKFDKNALAGLYINSLKNISFLNELTSDNLNCSFTGDIKVGEHVLNISGFLPDESVTETESQIFDWGMIPANASCFKYSSSKEVKEDYPECIKNLSIQNDVIGVVDIPKNDSLTSFQHIFILKSSSTGEIAKANNCTIIPYENYLIICEDKNGAENYLNLLNEGQTLKQNPMYQAIFKQYHEDDALEIIWATFARYDFLISISSNHTDKFYSLSIIGKP